MQDQFTALLYAAWNGHTEIARLLLEWGADLTLVDGVGEELAIRLLLLFTRFYSSLDCFHLVNCVLVRLHTANARGDE